MWKFPKLIVNVNVIYLKPNLPKNKFIKYLSIGSIILYLMMVVNQVRVMKMKLLKVLRKKLEILKNIHTNMKGYSFIVKFEIGVNAESIPEAFVKAEEQASMIQKAVEHTMPISQIFEISLKIPKKVTSPKQG
jgi:hypothetical protein